MTKPDAQHELAIPQTKPVLWALVHGRAAVRPDKQHSAFGYVVRHLYFYGQKDWPGGTSYEYRAIAKPFTR